MTTPQEARAIADMLQTDIPAGAVEAFRSLASQVEALTAELESWRFTNRIDELQRAHDSYKKQCLDARRMLCVYKSGPHPYMDDGEASDCSTTPFIDFLREDLEVIQKKLQARDIAAIAKGTA